MNRGLTPWVSGCRRWRTRWSPPSSQVLQKRSATTKGPYTLFVSPEQCKLERTINDVTKRINETCKQAKKRNPRVDDSEMVAFSTGKTAIICCGRKNSGKSTFLNSLLTGYANSGLFRANIKAETCDATLMEFGPVYNVEGADYPDRPTFRKALSQAQQRKRKAGTGTPDVIHAQVTPADLTFSGGGAAVLLDTPGINEAAMDGGLMATFVRDLIHKFGANVVMLYFVSTSEGLSTQYGQALDPSDKEFFKAAGIPGARLIVVGSKYDMFVDEQTVDEDCSDNGPGDGWGAARYWPTEQAKLTMANETFDNFKRSAAQELANQGMPGAAVLPCACLDEGKAMVSAVTFEARRALTQGIMQEIDRRVRRAQHDTQTGRCYGMKTEINKRMCDAMGIVVSPTLISECIAKAQPELNRADDVVTSIVEEKAKELRQSTWVQQHEFINALITKAYDPVQKAVNTHLRGAQQEAEKEFSRQRQKIAGQLGLEKSALGIEHKSGNGLLHAFSGNMLCTSAAGAAAWYFEGWAVANAARFAVGAGVGTVAVAAFTVASATWTALDWRYEDAIQEGTKRFLDKLNQEKLVFSSNLRRKLEEADQEVAASIAAVDEQTEDLLKPLHKEINDLYQSMAGFACSAPRPVDA